MIVKDGPSREYFVRVQWVKSKRVPHELLTLFLSNTAGGFCRHNVPNNICVYIYIYIFIYNTILSKQVKLESVFFDVEKEFVNFSQVRNMPSRLSIIREKRPRKKSSPRARKS